MKLPVQVEPATSAPPHVDYRWDPDTDILSARVRPSDAVELSLPRAVEAGDEHLVTFEAPTSDTLSGAVEVEGRDGSWIVLDVEGGHLAGIEVAIWPNVRRRTALVPPVEVEDARVRLAGRGRARGAHEPFEVTTRVTAESDPAERTIHFRLGPPRHARAVRLGRDLLVDVDASGHLAGVWLLNVPPVPTLT